MGVTAGIIIDAVASGFGAITSGLEGAALGAGTGALGDIATGKPVLPGLLTGALTGGAIGGLGPAIGSGLGIGTTAGDVLAGAGAGALGGAVTGQGAGTGAIGGGIGGLTTGLLSGATGGSGGGSTPTSGGGAGGGAGASAAPAGAAPGGATLTGSDTGATWSDSLTPATTGTPGGAGPIDTGALTSPLSQSTGGIADLFKKSNLGPAAALGGIGLDLLRGNTPVPGQSALSAQAAQLASQGQKLQSYLDTGTLPAGVSQSINQATQGAKAAIRSRYAAMGGDTSAMAQDLANVDQIAAAQGSQIAINLLNQGVSETSLSSQIYGQLLNLAVANNQALGNAIGTFAKSLTPVVLNPNG
jgi:hypothetical protein